MLAAGSAARPRPAVAARRPRPPDYFVGPGLVWVGLGSGSGFGEGVEEPPDPEVPDVSPVLLVVTEPPEVERFAPASR